MAHFRSTASLNPPVVRLPLRNIVRFVAGSGFLWLAVRPLDHPTGLNNSAVPWLFLSVLGIGLLIAMWRYRQPHARTARTLKKSADELYGSDLTDAEADGDPDGRHGPPVAFAKHKPLRDAWNRFAAARSRSGAGPVPTGQPTVSPTDYFTIDTVLDRNPGKLPDALPGVFTAVGLLGTFVGIALGLADIEPTAGTEDLMEGIRTLMGGMSTAFLTSIVGITWSVWWLFEWRFAERRLRSELDRFVQCMDQAHPAEEPHETLVRVAEAQEHVRDAATEVRDTTGEIKGNLQSLGQDLAEALEPYFEKHIAAPIRQLNTDLGQRQTEALKQMVEEFRATLVSSVQVELSALGQSLRDASDHQVDAARRLESFFDRLTAVSNLQMKLIESTIEAATVFDRGLARLTEASEAIEAAGRSARETMKAARDATQMAQGLGEESRKQLDSLEKVSEASARSWEAQSALLEKLAADFGRLAEDLGDKVAEFRTLAAQKIGEVFHVFDSEMAKVVDHLGGTLAELRDVTEELPRTVGKLQEATRELAEDGRAQRDILAEGLRTFEEARGRLAELFDRTRTETQELSGKLATASREMTRRQTDFATVSQSIQRGMEAMTDRVDKAGTRSSKDFQRLTDSVGSATDRLDGMAKAVGADMEPLARQARAATEGLERLSAQVGNLIGELRNPERRAKGLLEPRGITRAKSRYFAGQGRDGRPRPEASPPRTEASPTNTETSPANVRAMSATADASLTRAEGTPAKVETSTSREAGGYRMDARMEDSAIPRDATKDGRTTPTADNTAQANSGDVPEPPWSLWQRLFRRRDRSG